MAEAILNILGKGRFKAFSAGSNPSGKVQPMARELAEAIGYDASNVRSKNWDEFAVEGAPEMDIVITVCDNAANETCPVLFGDFVRAHWGQPDPAAIAAASARQAAFEQAHAIVAGRIRALLALPEALWNEPAALQAALDAIGASPEAAGAGT